MSAQVANPKTDGGTRNKSVPSCRPIHSGGSPASYSQDRVRGRARTESVRIFGGAAAEVESQPMDSGMFWLRMAIVVEATYEGRPFELVPVGPVRRRAYPCRSISTVQESFHIKSLFPSKNVVNRSRASLCARMDSAFPFPCVFSNRARYA